MKNNVLIVVILSISIVFYACSSQRATKRADPNAGLNEPMRKKNQVLDNNTSGHQNDQVREKYRGNK